VPVGLGENAVGGFRYLGQGTTGQDGRFFTRTGGLTPGWHIFVVYTSARAGTLRGSTTLRVHVA